MNKASKAFKRSSIRLKSMSTGHVDLKMIISDLRDIKSAYRECIEAQDTSWKDMAKWARKENNIAIADCFKHFLELSQLWTELQLQFLEKLNKFRNEFETILEAEVNLDKMREQLVSLEVRDAKLQKESQKLLLQPIVLNEVKDMDEILKIARSTFKGAHNKITDRMKENEAAKAVRVKEALIKLSDSFMDLAKKSCYIFGSQHDIASGLPEASETGIHDMKYRVVLAGLLTLHCHASGTLQRRNAAVANHFSREGSEAASQSVLRAKEAIRSYKRRRSFSPVAPPAPRYDCPPPYQMSPPHFAYSSTQATYQPMYSPPHNDNAASTSSMEGAVGWLPGYSEGYTHPRFMPWYDAPRSDSGNQ